MNIKKIIKYILIAIPLLFIAKWGIESVIYNSNKTPEINQNPTHKMKVHGKFPFEDEVKLDMALLFISTNPICDNNNWIAGIRFPQIFMKSFPATVKDGVFESDIYLDSYLPGMCEWQAYSVFALLHGKNDLITPYSDVSVIEKQPDEEIFKSSSKKQIGVIAYETFKEQGKTLNVECLKRKEIEWKNSPNTFNCDYIGEISRPVPDSGSKPKANISSSQKEVEINFINKGWKE